MALSFCMTPFKKKDIGRSQQCNATDNTRSEPPFDPFERDTDKDGVVIIEPAGDLVLEVLYNRPWACWPSLAKRAIEEGEEAQETVPFRVNSSSLTAASQYFRTLLDPHKFQEGISVAKKNDELRDKYPNTADIPSTELPRVQISDLGPISSVMSIRRLISDFLRIIHKASNLPRRPPLVNLANLAVIADRFDAAITVGQWVTHVCLLGRPDTRVYSEEQARQQLLVGLVFGHELWVSVASYELILRGASRGSVRDAEKIALWWDLPWGIEEEVQHRRHCILENISSLQNHLVAAYSSKDRQCRLGYDSSPQCDSFQLGEFIKFLSRVGIFRLQSALVREDEPEPFSGDIIALINSLRSCPNYQIDSFHAHCGPKKQMLAGLDIIRDQLWESHVGICFECWRNPASFQLWSRSRSPAEKPREPCYRARQHQSARHILLKEERDWTARLQAYGQ